MNKSDGLSHRCTLYTPSSISLKRRAYKEELVMAQSHCESSGRHSTPTNILHYRDEEDGTPEWSNVINLPTVSAGTPNSPQVGMTVGDRIVAG